MSSAPSPAPEPTARLRFDKTINVGTLIHLAVLLVALVGLYVKMNDRITSVDTKVQVMYDWWKDQINLESREGRRR